MIESRLPQSIERVARAAATAGLEIHIVEMAVTTRTAEEAARACGCEVAQIVKSLVFRGRTTGRPYLFLVSGRNRVDEAKALITVGEPLLRPDADYVREVTGFAIGGVPPLGHPYPIATYVDADLLAFPQVWAAAGTPRTVMKLDPRALKAATGAIAIAVY
jgi:prolyl-tRNA editing enzyme YbaK/EbsC (Cys-tRNA(Pro) deacylase)